VPYLHLNALSAALQEMGDALHPLILNVVKTGHWEHHVNNSVIDRRLSGCFTLSMSLGMPLGEWIGIVSI